MSRGLAPRVEGVIHSHLRLELLLIAFAVDAAEAHGDRLQPSRFRRGVDVSLDVGAVHDPRHADQARIVEAVLEKDRFEGASAVNMSQFGSVDVVRQCVQLASYPRNVPRLDVQELCVLVDEAPDQPRARDPVNGGVLTCHPPRHSDSSSVAAGALLALVLAQVLGDVPRPQLHDMTSGIRDVCGVSAAVTVAGVVVVQHLVARLAQPCDGGVVLRGGQVHRVVHVDAAPATSESDLGPPQADARAIAGHEPDRATATRPALHDGEPEQARVEALACLQVVHLERDLADPSDGYRFGLHVPDQTIAMKTQETRVVLTVRDFDRTISFFRDAIGLPQVAEFNNNGGRAVLLDAAHATFEVFDETQAAAID